jgi:ATP synthase protein I
MNMPEHEPTFDEQIGAQAARKLKARSNSPPGVGFGLGMMGIIGWSVAVPALLGITLGIWLDRNHPSSHSWTIALLFGGLALGCLNAWHWVTQEEEDMQDGEEGKHE